MELHLILHVLRNPHGKTDEEIKQARLAAADEIERLQRETNQAAPKPEYTGLQPLTEAQLIAADLRRHAKELLLAAQRLEATFPLPAKPKHVEYLFGKDNKENPKKKTRSTSRNKKG